MAIKIDELKKQYKRTLLNDEHTGIRKPAPTVAGIIKQAQKWLLNPDIADKGQGECLDRGSNLEHVGMFEVSHIM